MHPDLAFMRCHDLQRVGFAGTELTVMHTAGYSPGSVCLHLPEAGVLFSGDTPVRGAARVRPRAHSDYPTIIGSISGKLLPLPAHTVVHTGHSPSTTFGAEAPLLDELIARGH